MNYMKLIKLLYAMDRTALSRWGHPVTYDRYVSMPHGPVLSFTLDRINEGDEPNCLGYWSKFISPPSAYAVSLIADPQDYALSEAETGLIDEILLRVWPLGPMATARLLPREFQRVAEP